MPSPEACCATQWAWLLNTGMSMWYHGTTMWMEDSLSSIIRALIPTMKAPAGSGSSRCLVVHRSSSSRLVLFMDTNGKKAGTLIPVRTSSRAFSWPTCPLVGLPVCLPAARVLVVSFLTDAELVLRKQLILLQLLPVQHLVLHISACHAATVGPLAGTALMRQWWWQTV